MSEENWRRITANFSVPVSEDLIIPSEPVLYCKTNEVVAEKENRSTKMQFRNTRKKGIFCNSTEICNEEVSQRNPPIVGTKGTKIENIKLPLKCTANVHKVDEYFNELDNEINLSYIKQTIAKLENNLLEKENIILHKTEVIRDLERQIVALTEVVNSTTEKKTWAGLCSPKGTAINPIARHSEDPISHVLTHSNTTEDILQNENLKSISCRLDTLEQRMEHMLLSIPKEMQMSVEKCLKNYFTSSESYNQNHQYEYICSAAKDGEEFKHKLWNKAPNIQPRSNFTSQVRQRLRVQKINDEGKCFCQKPEKNSSDCDWDSSKVEIQIRTLEKVVETLKLNFLKLFKKPNYSPNQRKRI